MTKPEDVTDLSEGNQRINIDFDKTLTTGEGAAYWEEGEAESPDEEMVEWVNGQYHQGNFIIVWTARPWSQAQVVAGYLTKWGVEFNGIRCDKGGADIYVDDKAVNVSDVV